MTVFIIQSGGGALKSNLIDWLFCWFIKLVELLIDCAVYWNLIL